jgi:hypothetical protein
LELDLRRAAEHLKLDECGRSRTSTDYRDQLMAERLHPNVRISRLGGAEPYRAHSF